jgi:hypothetical protein
MRGIVAVCVLARAFKLLRSPIIDSKEPIPPGYLALRTGTTTPELEFLKRLRGLGTGEEEGYRTGPPGYIGWRNAFLGIDSGAPYTFKNTSSVFLFGSQPP